MYFEGFDTELLRVHGEAYASALEQTMAAGRRSTAVALVRRWVGERLVDLGAALAADPGLGREPRTANAGQQGC
jgi:hypothetical protein